ncbi:hypothetical protein LSH36_581g00015 [Paralvinella palmiformis]|uniref:E3 ubiquitin-protein ligase RBBP6 n=1 Tax=Paralvinella palmiformis TaxID=53620 RepID=A0AAD9J6C0_9ANNE|nr:hypothetical protein LSH36_581g00015 [Paralvinella palmiformis]
MSCIHYKFKSNLDYSTLTFDGLHITLGDLKKLIIQKQKLGKSPDFDLQVTNAQTKEVYKSDDELIPKNASVIVSRAPLGAPSKALGTASEASASPSQGEASASVANRISFEQLSQTPDLVNASASEDDKIRAMIVQSTQDYDQSNYVKSKYPTGRPHAGYVCHKCGQPGHFVATCPNKGLENDMPRIKRSTGIPQSFVKVVDNPNMPGAMVTNDGHFVVPLIDA